METEKRWLIAEVQFVQPPGIKGIVHRKMKLHSLSTHHYAEGGVCEVFDGFDNDT